MATITIQFDQHGGVFLDAEGFVGTSCKDATKQLEMVLAGKSKSNEKPEYYENAGDSVSEMNNLRF